MLNSSRKAGTLFVVATPIGNLGDITYRAVQTLQAVNIIAAEDTRHSRKLLQKYAISTAAIAYHEHNEQTQARHLVKKLIEGDDVALITDAGTPLISDPGYRLVESAHRHDIKVTPIPGCCAAVAALSTSGLPTDRYVFEGFLPAKGMARRNKLAQLAGESRTLVFYESSHRVFDTLGDLADVFGADRTITVAREITKQFETIKKGPLASILEWMAADPNQQKGEFVLLLKGRSGQEDADSARIINVLSPLMAVLPLKQAVALAAEITGRPKNDVYKLALKYKNEDG